MKAIVAATVLAGVLALGGALAVFAKPGDVKAKV